MTRGSHPDNMLTGLSDTWHDGGMMQTQIEWIYAFQSSEQRAGSHFMLIISQTICSLVTCFLSKSFGPNHLM